MICLHLGAHKTGTKYIQALLRTNDDKLSEYGCIALNAHDVGGLRELFIRARVLAEKGRSEEALALAPEIQRAMSSFLYSDMPFKVFSYEGCLGSMNLKTAKGLYPAARVMVQLLRLVFGDERLRICFCLRAYDEFAISAYNYMVKSGGEFGGFEGFKRSLFIERQNWTEIVKCLLDWVGAGNVYIADYKCAFSDKKIFLEWFFEEAIGVPVNVRALRWPEGIQNKSVSMTALSAALVAGEGVDGIGESMRGEALNREILAKLKKKLVRYVARNWKGSGLVEFSESEKRELDSRYRNDWHWIERLGCHHLSFGRDRLLSE